MEAKAVPLPKKTKSKLRRQEAILFYVCIAPFIIGIVFFALIPMGASLVLSFTKWDILTPPKFIGLENYITAFTKDPNFPVILTVTAKYALISVPLRLAVALFLAILLNEATRGVGFFRTAFYLPSIVSSVAAAVMFQWILNPVYGPVNGLLGVFGINSPNWFSDPKFALWGLIFMSPWGVGGEMLIFLAGLKGIDRQLYESASLDGAGPLRKFINITLPMLSPSLFFNLVMSIIGSFQTFDTAYVISTARAGLLGGPMKSTLFYMIYLYNRAFSGHMGYASALAWILFAIVMAMTLLVVRSSNLWVYYEAERKKD